MTDLKIEIHREVSPESRAELMRELESSAKVQSRETDQKDTATVLFVIAATVQTVDILWNWYQAARAKNKHWDVIITTAKGKKIQLKNATRDELRDILN